MGRGGARSGWWARSQVLRRRESLALYILIIKYSLSAALAKKTRKINVRRSTVYDSYCVPHFLKEFASKAWHNGCPAPPRLLHQRGATRPLSQNHPIWGIRIYLVVIKYIFRWKSWVPVHSFVLHICTSLQTDF
jgi:hypothetical protein